MDRKQLLKQKKKEIQKELEVWARKNLVLHAKERISFTMKIVLAKESVVSGELVIPLTITRKGGERIRSSPMNTPLTKKDWNKILSLRWSKNQLKVLKTLRDSNNSPLCEEEIAKLIDPPSTFVSSVIEAINHQFRILVLTFRLRKTKRGYRNKPNFFKIFKGELVSKY